MSNFSEILHTFVQKSELRAVDISSAMQLNKSYLSRMVNGKLLPKKQSIVTELADLLRLNTAERETLYAAYAAEKTRLPYDTLQAAMYRIFHVDHHIAPCDTACMQPLQNGAVLTAEQEIIDAIQWMLSEADGSIRILLRHSSPTVYRMMLQQLVNRGTVCKWLMPMRTGEGEQQAFENLSDFSLMLPVILNADVALRSYPASESMTGEGEFFPYCVITEKAVLIISADAAQAMYFDFPQVAALHCRNFDAIFEKSEPLCAVFDDYRSILLDYASRAAEQETSTINRMYVIARRPCVVFSVSQSAIVSHLNSDGDKQQMAKAYRKFLDVLSGSRTGKSEEHIFLAEEGIREFLCDEEFYEFNKCISLPISREIRHACFEKMLDSIAMNKVFDYNVADSTLLDAASNCTVNAWPDGRILLFYDFEDSYRIVIMNDPKIAQAFIAYFTHLRECGMTVSGKEVLVLMQQKYAEYGKK